jgi:hypothetical protein
MAELQQIIPRPGEIRPDKPYRTPDRRWEEVTKQIYGIAELPANIEFEHDQDWRQRVFSTQRAHDHEHWLWATAFYMLMFSDLAWFFMRMVR